MSRSGGETTRRPPGHSPLTRHLLPARGEKDLFGRPRIRIELVRRARVLAAGPPAHPREAELQAIVAGVDLRGVREGGAVAAGFVDVHRGKLRGAARGAEGGDGDNGDDRERRQRTAGGGRGGQDAERGPDEEGGEGEEEHGVEEAGDAGAGDGGEERGGGEAFVHSPCGE